VPPLAFWSLYRYAAGQADVAPRLLLGVCDSNRLARGTGCHVQIRRTGAAGFPPRARKTRCTTHALHNAGQADRCAKGRRRGGIPVERGRERREGRNRNKEGEGERTEPLPRASYRCGRQASFS
jgi:hypothetical protein